MSDETVGLKILIEGDAASVVAASGQAKDALTGVAGASSIPEEAPKSVEKLTLHHRQLATIIQRLVGRDFPELGHVISAVAFGGVQLAAIFGVVAGIEILIRALGKSREEAHKLAETAAGEFFAMQDATDAAAKSAEDFAQGLVKLKSPAHDITTEFTEQKKILDAQIEQEKILLEAQKKRELAAAGDDKAKKEAIEARYAALEKTNTLAGEQAQIRLKEQELFTIQQKQPALADAALGLEYKLNRAIADPEAAAAADRNKSRKPADLKVAGDQAAKDKAEAEAESALWTKEANTLEGQLHLTQLKTKIQTAQLAIDAYANFQKDDDAVKAHTLAVDKLTKQLGTAVKNRDEGSTAIGDQTRGLGTDRAVNLIHQHTAAGKSEASIAVAEAVTKQADAEKLAWRRLHEATEKANKMKLASMYEFRAMIEADEGDWESVTRDLRALKQITKNQRP